MSVLLPFVVPHTYELDPQGLASFVACVSAVFGTRVSYIHGPSNYTSYEHALLILR